MEFIMVKVSRLKAIEAQNTLHYWRGVDEDSPEKRQEIIEATVLLELFEEQNPQVKTKRVYGMSTYRKLWEKELENTERLENELHELRKQLREQERVIASLL